MTINVRPISLAMRFITLSDHLCIQHDAQDTACCVCPTETADICCVVLTVSLLWQNKYFAGLICFSCQLGISALSQWCYAIGTNAEMCRPECQNISTLVPKCPRTELSSPRVPVNSSPINSSHHKIAWQVDSIQNPCCHQWLHTLQLATLCVKSCFFPHHCSPSPYGNYWASVVHGAAEKLAWAVITDRWDQTLRRSLLCSLALIMPSMLHTVSGYYLSSTPVISAADFLMYSPVTSWPCDVLTMWRDDGVWQLDCVTIWLVAGSKVSGHFSNGESLCLLMPSVFWYIGGLGEKCLSVGTPWR